MAYTPIHFKIQEFVDEETYKRLGNKALSVMDDKILWTADKIREYFNKPVIINTWAFGGEFHLRGFRPQNCAIGATASKHKLGQAIDFDVAGMTAEQVRQVILKNYKTVDAFKYITGVELAVTWVHIDIRPYNVKKNGLFLFNA